MLSIAGSVISETLRNGHCNRRASGRKGLKSHDVGISADTDIAAPEDLSILCRSVTFLTSFADAIVPQVFTAAADKAPGGWCSVTVLLIVVTPLQ
jgi:hypothetical protein